MPLRRAPLHDQLTGEQPEAGQIILGVSENRQVPVVVDDLFPFSATAKIAVNLHTAGGKDGKLDLRHGPLLPQPPAGGQRKTEGNLVSFSFRRALRLTG